MRTTLDIEDDIHMAAKDLARKRKVSLGKVISDLARQALTRKSEGKSRHGIPLFPIQPGAGIVTLELVNRLRDED